MDLLRNQIYIKDVEEVANQALLWAHLAGKTVLISGAGGLIGKFMIDVLMLRNQLYEQNVSVIALVRNKERGIVKFREYLDNPNFQLLAHDITAPFESEASIDYIVHAASPTHPLEYSQQPIDTIMTNVLGTKHLLELATRQEGARFVLLSSVEIYGVNKGDTVYFDEEYCGYINCNSLRAGYPEGKRLSEALCQAYRKERRSDCVIIRLARTFGPTMHMDDSKALSQFIKDALHREDITLKSKGDQYFSYCYVGDAVSGIIKVMTEGIDGEAYNLAGKNSEWALKELAAYLAQLAGVRLRYELPDEAEQLGYSTASRAVLNIKKINSMNWFPVFDIKESLKKTLDILRECEK